MHNIHNIRNHIVGIDKHVKLLDGSFKQYIFFDNGASTPAFTYVRNKVNEILEWYSAVHRGNGIKSFITTNAYDEAHRIIAQFVNACPENHTTIFVKNTTEAINKTSLRLNLKEDDIILATEMEHHSNFLPWKRFEKNFDFIRVTDSGYLDLDDFKNKVEMYKGRLRLVAVTGGSNVTGVINPYHDIAEITHSVGALILLDAAQLAAHRKIDMCNQNDPKHIDMLVMSAHKMYAPYGSGVLICPKVFCEQGTPEFVGGGMAKLVTLNKTFFQRLPDKEEAGSPNTIGGIAFAAAIKVLEEVGMDDIAHHEIELTEYALKRFEEIPQVKMLVKSDFDNMQNRLGVVTFTVENIHYKKVAAVLCYEYGIGVRTGRFCAHPYASKLLGISEEEAQNHINMVECGVKIDLPGAVRASFGIYNCKEEVDCLINAMKNIVSGKIQGNYIEDENTGDYVPENYEFNSAEYFTI